MLRRKLRSWGWVLLYAVVLTGTVVVVAHANHEPIEEDATDKVTLTFRHFWISEHDRPMLNIFEDVVREFEEAHPNVKVNFDGMDQTIHREQKLKSEMVTGTPPDMFVLFGGAEIEPYVRSNRLLDLTEFVNGNRLENEFKDLKLWTFDRHVYGLPIEGNAEPLYVNAALFRKLGIAIPETLSELNEAVDVLRQHGYIPFALGNEERWPAAIFAHYLMDRYGNPQMIENLVEGNSGSAFQNAAYLKAFNQIEAWAEKGAFGPHPNDISTEEAIDLFSHGKAGMYLNGNWDITLFHNERAPVDFQNDIKAIPFPSLEPGGSKSLAGGYTIGIGLSSNLSEAQKKAALELMKSLYTTEVQERIVYEGLRIPSMRIPFDAERTGPVFPQVTALMEQDPQTFVPYDNMLSPEVNKSFLAVIAEMIHGGISAGDALQELDVSSQQYWNLRRSTAVK